MLHRRPAFHAEERFELENLIRRANHKPIDKRVPKDARDLIKGLLVVQPAARLTAQRALLEAPWISSGAGAAREAEREAERQRRADNAAEEEARRSQPGAFGL